LLTKSTWFSHG